MPSSFGIRRIVAVVCVGGCALLAGCLSGDTSNIPLLDSAVRTNARPSGSSAGRIVLRPEACSAPVRGTQVFIATVYDADGKPRPRQQVEWMIEGPGSIVEVADGGEAAPRGTKVDHKSGAGHTASTERQLTRGRDQFSIGPGQTWCVVTCAVEGETTVTAFCPGLNDWERNRAHAKISWTDADVRFPAPATARAGGEHALTTAVRQTSDRAAEYRVRYRIVDGPAAALTADGGGDVTSVREAVAPIGEDGSGKVRITQPLPAAGTNRIAIEVVKPDPDRPGQYAVVAHGETRVTWASPRLDVRVSAPKTLGVNQDVLVTYGVAEAGQQANEAVTLTARVPDEMVLIRTEPKAAVDGPTLIWTLPASDEPQTVTAIVRPVRVGSPTLTAEGRTADGLTGRGSAPVTITEAKLILAIDGPATGLVGETLPFRLTVTNEGDGPADRIRVQARFDDGLEATGKTNALDETISSLGAGQSKTIPLPLTARAVGKFAIQVAASGDRGKAAIPQTATVDVKAAQLSVSAHGPARGYIGQEANWQLVVRNTGDVPMKNVVVKATLPPEVGFVKTTDGGRVSGKQVVWDLGTAPAGQERTVAVTVLCNAVAPRAKLLAAVTGTPTAAGDRRSSGQPVGSDRPVETTIEIVGVAALQLSVKDSADPVPVGQRTTYLVRVKNGGTQAARKVEVSATVPEAMRPTRGTGPGPAATITGQRVTFPVLDALAPGAEASFVIEAEGRLPGDVRIEVTARCSSQGEPLRAVEPTRIIASESRPFDRSPER